MVEATDSSAGGESVQPASAGALPAAPPRPQENGDPPGQTDSSLKTLPPAPAASPATADLLLPEREAYRPLSLLALFGFLPAVLYALLILGGALIALFSRSHWLLPNWTFALPAIALLVCWIARTQIRNSEGVLAGQALTTWGIGLCLFFGLTYAAYAGATYFAIREQAKGFAQAWLLQVQQGKLERAFVLCWQSSESPPTDNAQLRQLVQMNNRPDAKGGPGTFTTFCQTELVRLLQNAGEAADIRLLGVTSWEYENGGYHVRFRYKITTPLVVFEADVTAQSTEPAKGQSGARTWFIDHRGTAALNQSMAFGEMGVALHNRIDQGVAFGQSWIGSFQQEGGERQESYLKTLPLAERQRITDLLRASANLGPATGPAPLAFRKGLTAFQNGDWVQIAPQFWAQNEAAKQEMIQGAKKICQMKFPQIMLMPREKSFPLLKNDGNKGMQLKLDITLTYRPDDDSLPYVVNGFLVVENPSPDAAQADAWRVKALELTDGHRMAPGRSR